MFALDSISIKIFSLHASYRRNKKQQNPTSLIFNADKLQFNSQIVSLNNWIDGINVFNSVMFKSYINKLMQKTPVFGRKEHAHLSAPLNDNVHLEESHTCNVASKGSRSRKLSYN